MEDQRCQTQEIGETRETSRARMAPRITIFIQKMHHPCIIISYKKLPLLFIMYFFSIYLFNYS
jgi:hypothetical protein